MLRKLLYLTGLLIAGMSSSYAANFYLAPDIVYQAIAVSDVGYNGVSPRLAVGYEDMLTDRIYAAAEVFGTPATWTTYNNPNNIGSARITYTYGASVLPGFNFDNTIIGYGRFGYIRARFDNLGTVNGGMQYGLGVLWKLKDCWSVRGEYAYTKFHNIAPIGHPDMNSYSVGLHYRFA